MGNFNEMNGCLPGSYPPAFGSEFPMEGPDIKGRWINKKTGQEVIVRDTIMSDDTMSVMLSDGRMISMNEFSSLYYQVSDDLYDSNGNVIGKCNEKVPVNVPDYNPGPCQDDFLHRPLPPHHHHPLPPPDCGCHDKPMPSRPPHHPVPPTCPPRPRPECPVDVEKKHMDMVTDVFSKVNPEPKVECGSTLVIENAPLGQLQMLIDIFGVHIEDIAIYLYQNYYTPEKVISYLKKSLTETYKLKEPEPANADKDPETEIDPDYSKGDGNTEQP